MYTFRRSSGIDRYPNILVEKNLIGSIAFSPMLRILFEHENDDRVRLQKICPLVRRLLNSSEWILSNFSLPDPETGWSVQLHYDEPDFPITVQTVAWSPQSVSPIHNHASVGNCGDVRRTGAKYLLETISDTSIAR